MSEIKLANQRGIAVVDDVDSLWLLEYRWFWRGGYAVTSRVNGKKTVGMHQLILGQSKIDHINGDRLDNRRVNLRPATSSQNARNSRSHVDSLSEYKGVSYHINRGYWQVYIWIDGKNKYLGHFSNEIDAALAYNIAAKKVFGEFARLNNVRT